MITSAVEKKTIRNIASYLVMQLMEYKNCSRDEALELLMKTVTYEALMEPDTELYLESREAVWDVLKEEMSGNPDRLLII